MPQITDFACDEREPLFFKKGCKWHFFAKKVCYVVIPHYLCIRKRTRDGFSWVRSAFALGSLCLRSAFALAPLLKVETKSVQNGMKKNSTSSIRLSNDSFFSEQYQFRLFCAVFGSARMLLKAACERRGVHFSATLSEPSTGRFLHLRSGFALGSLWLHS